MSTPELDTVSHGKGICGTMPRESGCGLQFIEAFDFYCSACLTVTKASSHAANPGSLSPGLHPFLVGTCTRSSPSGRLPAREDVGSMECVGPFETCAFKFANHNQRLVAKEYNGQNLGNVLYSVPQVLFLFHRVNRFHQRNRENASKQKAFYLLRSF